MVIFSYRQMKEEEARCIVAVDTFNVAKKRIQELTTQLIESDRDKKNAETTLEEVEREAESQRKQLRQFKDQLSTTKGQIADLKKKLKEAKKAKDQVEQDGYDVGVAKTEEALRAEVAGVCRTYYL